MQIGDIKTHKRGTVWNGCGFLRHLCMVDRAILAKITWWRFKNNIRERENVRKSRASYMRKYMRNSSPLLLTDVRPQKVELRLRL